MNRENAIKAFLTGEPYARRPALTPGVESKLGSYEKYVVLSQPPVHDGPVVTEEWDYRDHEWIPA